jgi:acetyltransferase EpsM
MFRDFVALYILRDSVLFTLLKIIQKLSVVSAISSDSGREKIHNFLQKRIASLKKIIILGGYGDGEVVASALTDLQSQDNAIIPYGFLNDHIAKGKMIAGLPVLDKIDKAARYLDQKEIYFISALLKVKENHRRSKKIDALAIPVKRFFTLIHPLACVAQNAEIGYGTFLGPHVTVMPNANIGNHCSFRASASIGHDCRIGNYCYMGPNATLSGRVNLEDGVHIGPNASVHENVTLGSFGVVGIGSVVLKDLPERVVAFGNPVKIINKI